MSFWRSKDKNASLCVTGADARCRARNETGVSSPIWGLPSAFPRPCLTEIATWKFLTVGAHFLWLHEPGQWVGRKEVRKGTLGTGLDLGTGSSPFCYQSLAVPIHSVIPFSLIDFLFLSIFKIGAKYTHHIKFSILTIFTCTTQWY